MFTAGRSLDEKVTLPYSVFVFVSPLSDFPFSRRVRSTSVADVGLPSGQLGCDRSLL